ncbi:hypothetical protein MRX96_052011 [Rhipicephalus microplus]
MKRTETRDSSCSSLPSSPVVQSRLSFVLALLVVSNVMSTGDTAAGREHDEEEAAAADQFRSWDLPRSKGGEGSGNGHYSTQSARALLENEVIKVEDGIRLVAAGSRMRG